MHIQLASITKQYEKKKVLSIPSLDLEEGYFWGIIGPNGSGKSTMLKIIAGLLEPTTGQVIYGQASINDTIRQAMTLVFQKPYLLRTSVYQNIAYPLQIRGYSDGEIKEKVHHMLETFGIEKLKHQKAKTLSGGEGQKVALARALVFKPRLLMLDEPTANIDPESIMLLEERIRHYYGEEQPTVLMVTHNIQQTRRLCNRVAFMYEGEVLDSGTVERIFGEGANPLVQSFIRQGLI